MPIKSNRFYNDPSIGAAFENLAAAFAPPSGADAAGWAAANAKNAEAARLAEAFNYAKDPNYSQAMADRLGVLGGLYAPSQSFYSVDQANATTRRGQDVSSRTALAANELDNVTARRGQDLTAQTALTANEADNARAIRQTQLTALGGMFDPVAEGAVRPEIPGNIAGMFGVDGPIAPVEGRQKPMTSDEVIGMALQAMPTEQVNQIARDKLAPTDSQVQGQQRRALVDNGDLTTQDLVNTIMGSVPVENVVGPDGQPVVVSRADAIGQRPFINPGATAKPDLENWVGPNGQGGGTAIYDNAAGQWKDTSTGQPLPAGSRTYKGQLQGNSSETGLGPTVANTTDANGQEAEITRTLGALDVYENLINENPGSIGLAGFVRGTAQNLGATATDLVGSFGKSVPEIEQAASEFRAGLSAVAPEIFDPAIPQAQFLQSTLAYALVRSENPSGEVSRQAYLDALQRVQGGGMLANSQSAKAAIGAQRQLLQNQLSGIRTLRNPGTGRTDTRFMQPPGAPAAPAPPPSGVSRKRYNPETGVFE